MATRVGRVLTVFFLRNQRQARRAALRAAVDVAPGGEADPRPPGRVEVPLHGLRQAPPTAVRRPTTRSHGDTAVCTEPGRECIELMKTLASINGTTAADRC